MSGFPSLPSRGTFGPPLEDTYKVTNPKREIGMATWSLTFWQLAAVSQLVPIAWVHVGGDGARLGSAEGWNPDGKVGLRPTTNRTGTGVYTVEYAAAYNDEPTAQNPNGVSRPLALKTGKVSPQGTDGGADDDLVGVATRSGNVFTVKITVASTGAAVDAPFLLEVRP